MVSITVFGMGELLLYAKYTRSWPRRLRLNDFCGASLFAWLPGHAKVKSGGENAAANGAPVGLPGLLKKSQNFGQFYSDVNLCRSGFWGKINAVCNLKEYFNDFRITTYWY
jgi:hypothetical protein